MQFPNPHDVKAKTIPGTEGWERMYPYQYQFVTDDAERNRYEKETFWFYDGLHYPEPLYPFDTIWDEAWYLALSQFNNRIFQVPPVRGVDHRIINGYVYISPVPVRDPEEIGARVPNFMERAGYYYKNWDDLEAKWKVKMEATIAELEALEIPRLPEVEDLSIVTDGVGESRGYHLIKNYDDLINLGIKCWQYHFEFLNLGYAAYVFFMDFAQKLFPSIPLQRVTQMISGIDVIMYRPDDELKGLAKKAILLGVDRAVTEHREWEDVKVAVARSPGGAEWLAAFEKARYPWFNISSGTGWFHTDRSWNDNLGIPLSGIQTYINKIRSGANIDRPMEQVRAERDRITAEYRELIANEADRQQFDELLGCAKTVFPYVENHLFYVEHWFHSVFWNKIRQVAAVMKEHGILDDVEDIWYLRRDEIKQALWDIVTAWATGVKPRGTKTWPTEIEWRKGVMQKFREWRAPPAIGVAPEVIQEPFTIVLWGVTNKSLSDWASVQDVGDPDSITEMKGFAASPGIVEGKARVCFGAEEIRDLMEDEILVAPTTSPSWAPAFAKIKACITDVGGVMSHAAIVCREYGMPAVVGTGYATKVIKSGMSLRVDGSSGHITIVR
ncbi:MAG: PEP-utilizing enzyme, mobile region [Rhodocyclaceae bacterium]|nr:PEP-utilizing enzyme, mobile region [Rhodocyclaceae bacterium]MBK6553738.1 PEP-utilizing enzyme, mobile region [Rhodocyclaceae bacterium]MBK9310983.1 PEP-utilizing enzyme, mobile region [Rhodocyclaceae bacterium]MBK9953947.1 PEP-utilizing enzyme, mobile region [Rhodocyclaceae bacterium]MCC8998918.1 PEP-utilizing enzyme, mobile region [Candidatus Contendobacter sp.]